jgi:hypothetical protein
MVLLALFSWWYGDGWKQVVKHVVDRVDRVLETFSVGTLMRTLFSPFRQISAGNVQGPLAVQARAFGDRLFSRVFGAFVRSIFIIVGLFAAVLAGLAGIVQVVMWPLLPALPVVGLIVAITGWTF